VRGVDALVFDLDASGDAVFDAHRTDRGARAKDDARAFGGLRDGVDERGRVDLPVVVEGDRAGEAVVEPRLERAKRR
jgi:hypothetical protein